jgi:nicotinate-nucleotide adenylyltransferase
VPERLGVFGGTFDPPHIGHLVTAVNVRSDLALDRVYFVVANQPWQKEGSRRITPAADRLATVRAAVAGVAGLEACDVEIERGGPSFTADTLCTLAQRHPGAELFVILGSDAAAGITTWERYAEVAERATIVAVDRPGAVPAPPIPGFRWIRLEVPRLEVSSTDLRARLRDGRPVDYLITTPVLDEVRRLGLYAAPE